MDKKEPTTAKIRYHYEILPNSRLHSAHGVWGGINSQGEIEINFYLESDRLPTCSEQLLAPDGSLGEEIFPQEEDVHEVTRQIHSRVLLNYHTAKAIQEWLQERLTMLEEERPMDLFPPDSGIAQ